MSGMLRRGAARLVVAAAMAAMPSGFGQQTSIAERQNVPGEVLKPKEKPRRMTREEKAEKAEKDRAALAKAAEKRRKRGRRNRLHALAQMEANDRWRPEDTWSKDAIDELNKQFN